MNSEKERLVSLFKRLKLTEGKLTTKAFLEFCKQTRVDPVLASGRHLKPPPNTPNTSKPLLRTSSAEKS